MPRRAAGSAVKSGNADEQAEPPAWRCYEPLQLPPILSAALDVFDEHGFHGASVRDIVQRAGQTLPSLYYHHENKEGAFVELLELGTRDLAWRVRAAAAEAGDRPDAQVANIVEAIVLHMTHRVGLAALDQESRHLSPAHRKRYAERRKEIEFCLDAVVSNGVARGVFTVDVPEEGSRAVLGMLQSIARWYNPDGPLKPEEIVSRYVALALNMLGVRQRTRAKTPRQP